MEIYGFDKQGETGMRKFRRWLVLFALPFAMALAAENVLFTPSRDRPGYGVFPCGCREEKQQRIFQSR